MKINLPLLVKPFLFCLLLVLGNQSFGQGAWLPANADFSYPRTLCKVAEIPAIRVHAVHPWVYPVFERIYNRSQGYNAPAILDTDRRKRGAAQAAKDLAFVYLLDRKPLNGSLDTLSQQERDQIRTKALSILNKVNPDLVAFPNFNEYIFTSNSVVDNIVAWDILKGAGVADTALATSRDLIIQAIGNHHREATTEFFGVGFFSTHINNHTLRTSGMLCLGALVFNDHTSTDVDFQPMSWLNTGLYHVDNTLWRDGSRQSEPGVLAGYSEGPHYLRFGLKHSLAFFHGMGAFLPDTNLSITYDGDTRDIRNPWYDDNYDKLWEWIMRIRLPDGRVPSIEDCFVDKSWPELAIFEKPQYVTTQMFTRLSHLNFGDLFKQLTSSSDDMIPEFIASQTLPAPDTFAHFQPLKESGDLIFRSGWDTLDTYMYVVSKNGQARTAAKGHNQADVGSFQLYGYGQLLALDPGYLKWDRRSEVGNASDHSMILVDGAGPLTGGLSQSFGADGFIENDADFVRLDHAEVRTAYEGADITRKFMFVRENYFIVADRMRSASNHSYQWQLHAWGLENGDSLTGYFTYEPQKERAFYRKNGVSLMAVVTGDKGADRIEKYDDKHEIAYDTAGFHTVFQVFEDNQSDAEFVAVLAPFVQDTPKVQSLCAPDCGAMLIEQGGYRDVVFTENGATASATGLAADLSGNGSFSFWSEDNQGTFDQFVVTDASELKYGQNLFFSADQPSNLSLTVQDSATYAGHCATSGTVYFHDLEFVPQSVLGTEVTTWSYDANTGVLTVVFSGAAGFTIHEDLILSWSGPSEASSRFYPNPAKDFLYVESKTGFNALQQNEARIYDLNGKLVFTAKVNQAGKNRVKLNLGGLASGSYLFRLGDSSGVFLHQ